MVCLYKVERALILCINGDYDFMMNKLILKLDLNNPKKKSTMNMFAFSEAA